MENRKVQNVWINPKAQVRFAVPFLTLFSVNIIALIFVFMKPMSMFSVVAESGSPEVMALLNQLQNQLLITVSFAMLASGVIGIVVWLKASHRILGPMVPIQRQLERFAQGDYSQKVTLRKNDEFQDLASSLNQLGTILQSKSKV
ncbi:MAG: HAMP domain-containing protein [Pseudobdellovibrionaceae bacterium]